MATMAGDGSGVSEFDIVAIIGLHSPDFTDRKSRHRSRSRDKAGSRGWSSVGEVSE